jgi:hypothetical protein
MRNLQEAVDNFNKGGQAEDSGTSPEAGMGEKGAGTSGAHAVHHHDHGTMHSKHVIGHDGKAQSTQHKPGEGGGDCPFCGGTGQAS